MLEHTMPTIEELSGSITNPNVEANNVEINSNPNAEANNVEINSNPNVEANNVEIKLMLISIIQASVQFGGLPSEDPIAHLRKFLRVTDILKYNGVSEDVIRMQLFPFSLTDKAEQWLSSLPSDSITTWDQLNCRFLAKYYPTSKSLKLRADIFRFEQFESESLYEAWERFQELMYRCPDHGLPKWQQVLTFYEGLSSSDKFWIDAACRGTIMSKTPEEAYVVIENMASNGYQSESSDIHVVKKQPGNYPANVTTALEGQLEALTKKMESLMQVQNVTQFINSIDIRVKTLETQMLKLTEMMSQKVQGVLLTSQSDPNLKE